MKLVVAYLWLAEKMQGPVKKPWIVGASKEGNGIKC
jgi:hypothetical protein